MLFWERVEGSASQRLVRHPPRRTPPCCHHVVRSRRLLWICPPPSPPTRQQSSRPEASPAFVVIDRCASTHYPKPPILAIKTSPHHVRLAGLQREEKGEGDYTEKGAAPPPPAPGRSKRKKRIRRARPPLSLRSWRVLWTQSLSRPPSTHPSIDLPSPHSTGSQKARTVVGARGRSLPDIHSINVGGYCPGDERSLPPSSIPASRGSKRTEGLGGPTLTAAAASLDRQPWFQGTHHQVWVFFVLCVSLVCVVDAAAACPARRPSAPNHFRTTTTQQSRQRRGSAPSARSRRTSSSARWSAPS